tara:strand:+ start:1364 stop:1786 length:423 start_codon:yes stop_codon:yes gene_type:complete
MEDQDRISFVLEHYKTEICKDQSSFGKCDFQIYSDYTSDGYKLTIAKYNENILSKDARGIPTINKDPDGSSGKVFLNEHVFHNNYDLSLVFIQEMRKGDLSIYIDEEIYEDAMIDSYLEQEYDRIIELQEKDDELYDNFI